MSTPPAPAEPGPLKGASEILGIRELQEEVIKGLTKRAGGGAAVPPVPQVRGDPPAFPAPLLAGALELIVAPAYAQAPAPRATTPAPSASRNLDQVKKLEAEARRLEEEQQRLAAEQRKLQEAAAGARPQRVPDARTQQLWRAW